jgi:hypothetical protein
MHERDAWVYLPIGLNVLWLFATVAAGQMATLSTDGIGCALVALFTSGVAIVAIFGFVVHDIGPAKTFLAMFAQTIVLVLVYSLLYLYRLNIENIAFDDALYYSVVTWTSLGYSDLNPVGEMKFVTALQAITGYVFLGLLVSVLASVVGQPTKSS